MRSQEYFFSRYACGASRCHGLSGLHVCLLFLAIVTLPAHAEPSLTGQTGLITMPDARIDPDGTWRTGYSIADPYAAPAAGRRRLVARRGARQSGYFRYGSVSRQLCDHRKKLGDFDFTFGYGTERIDGAFGGVRYHPQWLKGWWRNMTITITSAMSVPP